MYPELTMPRIRAETIAEHKELTRRQILEAIQELIAEAGSADISMGDIASMIGIGRTTLYEYFDDVDDIIASMVEEQLPGVIAGILTSVPTDLSPRRRLVDLAEQTVRFVASDPVLGVILHREVGRLSAAAQRRITSAHEDLVAEVASIYVAGVEAGELRDLPVDLAGRFIHDTIMSAARAVIASSDPDRRLPQILEATRIFLLGGLSAD